MDEWEYKLARWIVLRNIALVVMTGLCMYFINPWCWMLLLFSTSIITGEAANIKARNDNGDKK